MQAQCKYTAATRTKTSGSAHATLPVDRLVPFSCWSPPTHAQDDAAGKDLEKLQGNWALVSAERDGKKHPDEDEEDQADDSGQQVRAQEGRGDSLRRNLKLGLDQKPKEITETITAGPNKGKVSLAICEIDDDQHRICFAAADKARPTKSPPRLAAVGFLQVWRRDRN